MINFLLWVVSGLMLFWWVAFILFFTGYFIYAAYEDGRFYYIKWKREKNDRQRIISRVRSNAPTY